MTESIQLAVVGAGPAGLAAALEAEELGLPVTLIDLFPQPGGQYFKQAPVAFGVEAPQDGEARRLLHGLGRPGVRLMSEASAWGIFPDRKDDGYLLGLCGPGGTPRRLRARTVILATGAYDRPVPFPGWTLPGVMTAGAALTLLRHQRVLPGQRVLLSGTGPLQLVLAQELIDAGADLAGILDANPFPWQAWRHLGAVWGQWERLREGFKAWWAVRRARGHVQRGHTAYRAQGDGRLEKVVIGPIDGAVAGPDTVRADALCLSHGFLPATELSCQAGCEHRYRADQAAIVPVRDEWLQTTRAGLFAAGDCAGVCGKDVAMLEGRLAAMGAARHLGRPVPAARILAVKRELVKQRRFAAVLDDLFPSSPGLADLLTEDTVICRCEEITVGEVRSIIAEGATTMTAVRRLTRAGMGRCQGRMCASSITRLVAEERGCPVEAVRQATGRAPIVPVPLEELSADEWS